MSRMNLRYSRDRVFGDSPWKGMKTSCATSSRRVMPRIHLFTAAEAFTGGGAAAVLGRDPFLRTAGSADSPRQTSTIRVRKQRRATISVSQIQRVFARTLVTP